MNNEFLQTINKMRNGEIDMEEMLKEIIDRKIEQFVKSCDEIDMMMLEQYRKIVQEQGIQLPCFLEPLDTKDQVLFVTSLVKGYVKKLFMEHELEYTDVEKENLKTMFNFIKAVKPEDAWLQACLFSLINE